MNIEGYHSESTSLSQYGMNIKGYHSEYTYMSQYGLLNVQDRPEVTFILKKAPNASIDYFKYNNQPSNVDGYPPIWFICKGEAIGRPIRFTGNYNNSSLDEMHVSCWDKIWQYMFDSNMSWYVKGDILQILLEKRRRGRGGRFGPEVGSKAINDNINVIRLRMYWVLRGIVGFKQLLARVHMRAKRRKLFIQATYWGHPECAFSRFSGTINTPVKQRIYAFI